MANVAVEPYLFFKGNAREAMEFYQSVFGGKLDARSFKDTPGTNPDNPDWLVHASLRGGDITLLATDSSTASDQAAKVELCLSGTDEKHMREIFDKLSAGGQVRTALKKQFWGDIFGSLTDKYGVDWMMNIGDNMGS
jgi:PhnB protein